MELKPLYKYMTLIPFNGLPNYKYFNFIASTFMAPYLYKFLQWCRNGAIWDKSTLYLVQTWYHTLNYYNKTVSNIESKLNSYSHITNLHIFVYERAELSSISNDCTYIIPLYIYLGFCLCFEIRSRNKLAQRNAHWNIEIKNALFFSNSKCVEFLL